MELYYFAASPPCRAVMLFMKELNLEPKVREVDLKRGQQLDPEFIKLNPQHTIPVLVDNDFVLSESRAILIYLAETYGEETNYYPPDSKARGIINQRLMFDIGTLTPRFAEAFEGMFLADGPIEVDPKKLTKLEEAFEFLEAFMAESTYMAGDFLTIADFSLVATISSIEACGFDVSKYENITSWLERCKSEISSYEEVNQNGVEEIKRYLEELGNK